MEWILCADRLPKNDDWKIITILDELGDIPYRYSDFGWYFDNAKCWIVDAEPRTDVIAWMSLPLPYTADRKTEPQFDKDINVRSKTEPQTCDTCRYDKEPWHRQVCDECTVGESNWKPKDEPQTDCAWKEPR